ncbi:MAG TPA: tRNA (N6-isopentenyl adenosine(37)-C2)-methylthiotransferase MiaB [Myxococcaceae bacterium]|nr:tRNA (N6-isopentenyl adenosine(37)-C2)-methylthiotransferase MiaB [Myxococcaceae bacterium]
MKRYFVHTFGCQMNVNDSLRMGEALATIGYRPTPSAEKADLIILNTCAIREKAEDKMLSALGRYRAIKTQRGALLAVGGCVAQQEKGKLLARVPYLDFVFGPDAIGKLPELVTRVVEDRVRVTETAWVDSEEYVFPRADPGSSAGKVSEFVTVMKGCDNVCSFCVVPHTRGREVSRPFVEVIQEIASLTTVGVREVTLIGQNVNSYRGGISFAELLLRVAQIPGIERVRFTTSHPHDLSDALIDAFRTEPRIAPHFHLPVQSGSDEVLRRMKRDYTVAAYLQRLAALRAARPGIAVTTDIIVGFPGETEEDFRRTLALTEQVRYENQFSFVFSARPRTVAALKEAEWGPVPHEVKVERLERLQAIQRRISAEIATALVDHEVEVLVEGPSRSDPSRRFGRTPENRTVNFDGTAPAGARARVRITRGSPGALLGVESAIVDLPPVPPLQPRTEAA